MPRFILWGLLGRLAVFLAFLAAPALIRSNAACGLMLELVATYRTIVGTRQ